jgi:hypothetical protein
VTNPAPGLFFEQLDGGSIECAKCVLAKDESAPVLAAKVGVKCARHWCVERGGALWPFVAMTKQTKSESLKLRLEPELRAAIEAGGRAGLATDVQSHSLCAWRLA